MTLEKLKLAKNNPKKPLLCLEVNPPRGVNVDEILSRLDGQLQGLDFFNVTDSALARMKLAGLPFASILKQRFGIDAAVNVSCRDRNLIALQADLLAGWVLGVRSVIALTGDAMTIGDSPDRKGVFEVNSVGLLNVIKTLASGKDIAGNELNGAPSYLAGVVVNPNVRNPAAELKRLQKKKDAGACYALSQPVFDVEVSTQFFKQAKEIGLPILVGLIPWKTAKSAINMSRIPGIRLPDALIQEMQRREGEDLSQYSIDYCLKLAEANREYVAGFHVVSGATPKLSLKLLQALAAYIAKL